MYSHSTPIYYVLSDKNKKSDQYLIYYVEIQIDILQ